MKELKDADHRDLRNLIAIMWNPVKELKATSHERLVITIRGGWNPVKELKVIRPGPDHLDLDNFVESGEGIESFQNLADASVVFLVESGEGIERKMD